MSGLFGTDGIRGLANDGLDIHQAQKIGLATGLVIGQAKGSRPVVAIGKDTRLSSDMLDAAIVAGLCAAGADVMVLGVVPTPAVAFITAQSKADAGIMLSASHNPFYDNGIKIFNGEGFKLSDNLEEQIETLILQEEPLPLCTHEKIGKVLRKNREWTKKYIDHLEKTAEGELSGLKVLIDCSHGAAFQTASSLFSRLDLDVTIRKDRPNGLNINENCGSTAPAFLQEAVVSGGYDLGIAFDGDADRCILVDEKGAIINGDKIMGVCAKALLEKGKLKHNTLVATVMSNLGLHDFAAKEGISLLCTGVGDRLVLEEMLKGGFVLGGEQSGHFIFLENATTGDGQLAAIKFLDILCAAKKPASELVREISTYPQELINITIEGSNEKKEAIMASKQLQEAIAETKAFLADKGRVLVRPSGTEPMIRVMVEAKEENIAKKTAENLANLIKAI